MLSQKRYDEIQRWLGVGLSQRRVAALAGVSRDTVSAIALGRRRRREDDEEDPEGAACKGLRIRCPGCGGLVSVPCRLCRVRARIEQRQNAEREKRRAAARATLIAILQAQRRRLSA